ncbi:MAG: response regulator [Lachnospiraceae bacterium]|nr:response regulator [Lachnospiraceae bacterium]
MYKILIVDDERNERTGIEKLIRRFHYPLEIRQAARGQEALEIMERERVDILLTDIKMPFMTGMELIENVHKKGIYPICVIYSAYGEFEYAQNAISLGVVQYLLKPIKISEFQELFDRLLSMCEEEEKQKIQNEQLKQSMKMAENERLHRQILRYLESESSDLSYVVQSDFEQHTWIPVVLCNYSYLFSRFWENYENDMYNIIGKNAFIINKDDSQLLIFMRADELQSGKTIEKICEDLISLSKTKYQSEIFMIVGAECGKISELKSEYEKMREQLDYQFFLTESSYFIEEENRFIKKKSDMLPLYFEKIATCCRLKDYSGMKAEFEKAFEYVEKTVGFSSIYIKFTFSEEIKQCCEILNNSERILEVVEDIYDSHSISQVKSAVLHLIDDLAQSQTGYPNESRTVFLAKRFVHDHFQDCTLSVSSIADELNLSAAYLSTLFKTETKQTLVKYISSYRLEKAKELLVTTNMKIVDVSEKVGYMNTSYFISLFRNNTGCSPAKYRERTFRNE